MQRILLDIKQKVSQRRSGCHTVQFETVEILREASNIVWHEIWGFRGRETLVSYHHTLRRHSPEELEPSLLSNGYQGLKRPGREADHSPPSSAKVELYLHSPNTPPWCGAQLKHRDDFTFYEY